MIYLQRGVPVVSGFRNEKTIWFYQITRGVSFQIFGLPGFPLEHEFHADTSGGWREARWIIGEMKGTPLRKKRSLMKLLFFTSILCIVSMKGHEHSTLQYLELPTPTRTRLNFPDSGLWPPKWRMASGSGWVRWSLIQSPTDWLNFWTPSAVKTCPNEISLGLGNPDSKFLETCRIMARLLFG